MDNSLLIGLSQQAALRRHLDIIANNLANLTTPGFRAEQPVFGEFVMPVAEDGALAGPTAEISYVQDKSLFRDFSFGRLEASGNPLDVALGDKGWFAVQTTDGERYTRAGRFMLDSAGQLVTLAGDPVLGDGGPIVFEPGETGIKISADGTVATSAGVKGRLRVVEFANERALAKEGGGLFSSPFPPGEVALPNLAQGMLEMSNVNAIEQITEMIRVTRSYESTARLIAEATQLNQDAIETLGTSPA